MKRVMEKGAEGYVELMKSENKEIKLHAVMIISNIAREEKNCQRLVELGVVKELKEMVKDEDPRLQNLSVTAIRNLAIPNQTLREEVALDDDLFLSLIYLLENSINALVIYSVVVTFKVFLLSEKLVVKFEEKKCLSSLLSLFDRNLSEGQERIYYETARLLVRLLDTSPRSPFPSSYYSLLLLLLLLLLFFNYYCYLYPHFISLTEWSIKQEDNNNDDSNDNNNNDDNNYNNDNNNEINDNNNEEDKMIIDNNDKEELTTGKQKKSTWSRWPMRKG